VTKKTAIGSRDFRCKAAKGLGCLYGKFENEIGRDTHFVKMLGWLRTLPNCS